MKNAETLKDDLRNEYQSADFPAGLTRGKYAARAHAASNIAVLEPDIALAFPNSAAVNAALRGLLRFPKSALGQP
jgi:septum formation inhibitor-activating ATPase MinD